jgi:thioesterase domain-containing protein
VTVEEIAVALQAPAMAKGLTRRVYVARNVRTPSGRPPLFFLHGDYGGGGLYCLQLAVHLGRDQPLYALAPHGLDGEPLPPSVEAMAADRLTTLREVKPAGPYRLGGYCNGAVVAFEMARQLHSQGEHVERLVLVAPVLFPPPAPLAPPSLADSLRRIEKLSPRALASTVRDGLAWRLKSLAPRILGHRRVLPPPTGSRSKAVVTAAAARDRLSMEYSHRMREYWPAPYPGAVTVLHTLDEGGDPSRIWSRLAARVDAHAIPGEHLSCITIHVRELARHIRTCLDAPEVRRPA